VNTATHAKHLAFAAGESLTLVRSVDRTELQLRLATLGISANALNRVIAGANVQRATLILVLDVARSMVRGVGRAEPLSVSFVGNALAMNPLGGMR
jgi:hypothetical protein